jgi:outer membrane receptor protein involved in Fe transport
MPFDFVPLLPVMLPNQAWGSYRFQPLAPRPDLLATLSDDQVTGTAKLSFFPNDSSMFYVSYASGFKSGGTNTDRISPAFNPIFGAETSESIEAGFKGDLGPVRLSVAVYQTDYEDFQANSFTGTGFNLQNAGDVETSGFEVEALWRPFDTFEVQAFVARSEGDFKTFVGGTCRDTAVFHTGQPDPGGDGTTGAEVCSRTGDVIPYNPEDRAFVALTKDFPFGNNNLFIRGEWSFSSEQFTDGDVDPFTRQDDFNIVNLRIGMNIDDWNSDLTIWGRNITDERYYNGSFDAPVQLGRMNSYPSEPSTYGITFRKNFD